MKSWLIQKEEALSGFAVVEKRTRPKGAILEWPKDVPGAFAQVCEILLRNEIRDGQAVPIEATVVINSHLVSMAEASLQEEVEKMGRKIVVVQKLDGSLGLVETSTSVTPPNYLADAAPGFVPGDEKHITKMPEGLVFDYASKENEQAPLIEQTEKVESWNEQTLIQRIKSAYRG